MERSRAKGPGRRLEERARVPHLQRTASGHGLVGVQRRAQLFAKELADSLLDGGNPGGATDNLHCIDVLLLQLWEQEARWRMMQRYSKNINNFLKNNKYCLCVCVYMYRYTYLHTYIQYVGIMDATIKTTLTKKGNTVL